MAGAVVELLPVDVATAAAYLSSHHAPQAAATWKRMASAMVGSPQAAAVAALRTPLMLVLARDTYTERGDPMELLDAERFPDAGAVEDHLLDRLVRLAYERVPPHSSAPLGRCGSPRETRGKEGGQGPAPTSASRSTYGSAQHPRARLVAAVDLV
jgi:hypothetical protein